VLLAALAMSTAAAGAGAASALEPGVHVDPGSPAAKEYALPLNQARHTGSSSQSSPETSLFGAGIKPPSSGGSTPTRKDSKGAQRAAGSGDSASSGESGTGVPTLAHGALLSTHATGAGGGDGSILALIGGGVAILVLGGFGGTVLRHSRRGTA